MRSNILYTLLFALVGLIPTNLLSQNRWVSPDYVKEGIPFMMSLNPCGLIWMDTLSVSEVTLGFNKNNGGLVNYHQSNNDYRIQVAANSIYRFNKKVILRGAMDYSYYQGRNMSGSFLMDPYYNAFDIVEFDDSFKGNKNLERYHILAELGYNVYKGLTLGASFDLVSANYSKMKDLRHSNTFSDIQLDLALAYSFGDVFSLGASYHYRKSIEGIYFKRYSISEMNYYVLVSAGGFWGKRKTYDDVTGMISQSTNPIINKFNGASLQMNIRPSDRFTLFIEGKYNDREGSLGIKSPRTFQYYIYDGYDYGVSASAVITPSRTSRHVISFDYASAVVNNYEDLYKIGVNENGTQQITYFDPVFLGKTLTSSYKLGYRADWMIRDFMPLWSISLEADLASRQRMSVLYPYYRRDDIKFMTTFLEAERNIVCRQNNLFTVGLGFGYRCGLGNAMADGSYIPNPTQVKPWTSEMMLGRELEYLTSSQILLTPSFRYTRKFRKLSAYADVDYSYRRSLEDVSYLQGNFQHTFNITLGIIL